MNKTLEITRVEPAGMTPMRLIELAAERGSTIEQMAQLFELKLRVEADEAKKAFNFAMAGFKRTPPQINKNKHVKVQFKDGKGGMEYDHATLDHVVDAIGPALSSVGIRHRWDNNQADAGWVSVTCILSHELGHSESTTLKAQVDSSGNKNAIQAIASTVTYLQRYTLLSATGMAAVGMDNDAAGGPSMPVLGDEEFIAFRDNIDAAETQAELKKFFSVAYTRANELGDQASVKAFIDAKDKRKRALA